MWPKAIALLPYLVGVHVQTTPFNRTLQRPLQISRLSATWRPQDGHPTSSVIFIPSYIRCIYVGTCVRQVVASTSCPCAAVEVAGCIIRSTFFERDTYPIPPSDSHQCITGLENPGWAIRESPFGDPRRLAFTFSPGLTASTITTVGDTLQSAEIQTCCHSGLK